MYLLQTSSDTSTLMLITAAIISLFITYYIIKSAINRSRATNYQEAQMKILALMAKNSGIDRKLLYGIVMQADKGAFKYDPDFKKELVS